MPGARGAGISYARCAVWLLSAVAGGELLRLDPESVRVTARVPLGGFQRLHPYKEVWSLESDDTSLWTANSNYNMLTQVEAVTARVKRRVRFGSFLSAVDEPEGLDLAGGSLWVAARTGVARLDSRSGKILGVLSLPPLTQFTSIAAGGGATWRTDFYRATLTRVTLSEAAAGR